MTIHSILRKLTFKEPAVLEKGGKKSTSVAAPDFAQLARVAERQIDVGEQQALRQEKLAKEIYDRERASADKVAEQQMRIADETAAQGRETYQYGKRGRAAEEALRAEALGWTGDDFDKEREALNSRLGTAKDDAERAAITEQIGNLDQAQRALDSGKGAEEVAAGQAVADVRQGIEADKWRTLRMNQRLGRSQTATAAGGNSAAAAAGLATATAANAGRTAKKNELTTKRLGVSSLYRGMDGTGAYGLSLNAGRSALDSEAGANARYTGAITNAGGVRVAQTNAGAGTQVAGFNAQTNAYNQQQAGNAQSSQALMGAVGMGVGAFM